MPAAGSAVPSGPAPRYPFQAAIPLPDARTVCLSTGRASVGILHTLHANISTLTSRPRSVSNIAVQQRGPERHSRAPLLFLSLVPLPVVVTHFSLCGSQVAGTSFLDLPFKIAEFLKSVELAQPISDEATLQDVIRRYCRFEERRKVLLHD